MTIQAILTKHAQTRLAQRGISAQHLNLVLRYGQAINRQGYLFYYIAKPLLNKYILSGDQKYVRNLVVVVSGGYSPVVVTAYKEELAVRNIKKKSKNMIGYLVKQT